MLPPLLTTKLYIPPSRPNLVHRPRLIERLDEALRLKHRLILISAPAGFGKTTLLSEWARHRAEASPPLPQIRVAWLSLDEDDNDPARFMAYLIAALQTINKDVGASVLAALQSPQRHPVTEHLTALINQVNAVPDRFALVLDDYHAVTAQAVHDALAFLLDHMPPQMHVVVATRADPALPVARLRGRGQLTDLRQSDLRFMPDEVAAFLNRAIGLALSETDVRALISRTEGWIAGLQMAAISLRGEAETAEFIRAFAGSHRYVLDYLVEEVLERQPKRVQTFLLQTSILDRLSGPLCDAVSQIGKSANQQIGRSANRQVSKSADRRTVDTLAGPDRGHPCPQYAPTDSQAMLEYLERNNLFVVPLDGERRWYRYHHLFSDLLQHRLVQAQPDLAPILHGRASAWYEQNGLPGAAIDHALSAGDFEWAAHLVEQSAESTMLRSEVDTLRGWIGALPEDVVRARPLVCIYDAVAMLFSSRPLETAMARVHDAEEADSAGSVAGHVIAFHALLAAYRGDARRSAELSERALALLPPDSLFFRSLIAGYLGLSQLYAGNLAAARDAFAEAARISQEVGNVTNAVLALQHLGDLYALQCQFSAAKRTYQQALDLAVDEQGRRQPIAGMALIGLGRVLREQHDLAGATRLLQEGIDLVKGWGEAGAISGYIGLALARQAQGDVEGARAAMETAERLASEFDAMEADDIMVAVYKIRLWLTQGHVEPAERWLEQQGWEQGVDLDQLGDELAGRVDGVAYPILRIFEYITVVRVYMAQGRTEQALGVLEPLLRYVERAGWSAFALTLLTLQALALSHACDGTETEDDVARAMVPLERALSLAEPDDLAGQFLDEGEPMYRLLRHAAARVPPGRPGPARYVHRLLSAFEQELARVTPTPAPGPPPETLVEPLSERELQVLRLLTTHLSTTEIAEELFLSVNTVRSHVKNIYSKLNVHSRADAVQRGQELGLL